MDSSAWMEDIGGVIGKLDPEYLRENQAEAIGSLWSRLRPKRILEVGTFKGTGACLMAAMCRRYGGHVTTVDLPWTANTTEKLTVLAEEQVATCGFEDDITIIRRADGGEGFLKDHALAQNPPWDFIYIDGGHEWIHTAAQFVASLAAIRHGGWLCMDDLICPPWPDVALVWEKVVCKLIPLDLRYESAGLGFVMRVDPNR